MKQIKLYILGIVVILVAFGWYFSESRKADAGPVAVGKKAPDFSLQDMNGRTVQLSDYRGKYVVLNFWATWCPPCVEEAPSLDQFSRRLAASDSQKIAVLSVSVDSGWDPVRAFVQAKNISFPVLLDSQQDVPNGYGTFKYPETYIIDPSGVVIKKVIGGLNWMSPDVRQFFDNLLHS